MAAFTSKATGNWNSAGQTTWNEVGTPGNGDTVTVSSTHVITVTANAIIGTSPNDITTKAITYSGAGTLAIAAGVSLTVRGNVQVANGTTLTLGAGASFIFDNAASGGSPIYVLTNAGFTNYTFSGTSVARCTFGAISGQTCSISGAAWATFAATFTDFNRISAQTIATVSTSISISDCTFTGCDQLRITHSSASIPCILHRLNFVSGTHATLDLNLSMSTAMTSGTREIIGCVLQKGFTNLTKSFTIIGNYFGGGMEEITANSTHVMFRHNFVKQDGDLGGGNGALYGSSVKRNYFVVENIDGNPHYIQPQALMGSDNYVEQNVFEAQTPDLVDTGDCVIINGTAMSGGNKVIGRNNIVLKNGAASVSSGTLLTLFNAPATSITQWTRNTVNINDSAISLKRGAFAVGEGGTGFAGQLEVLKSNLVWGTTASQGYFGERVLGNVKDIITIAGADYNWRYNLSAGDNQRGYEDKVASNTLWTLGDAVAAGVDTHSGTGDPDFYDDARNIASWNLARAYGLGTYAAGLTSLQADPTRIEDLIEYIFEGYRVQNADMRTAAHDGGVVGAANYLNPDRALSGLDYLGAYLQDKYTIDGESVGGPDNDPSLELTVSIVRGVSASVSVR